MSAARKGKKLRPRTPEEKLRLSAALKGRANPAVAKALRGRKLSPEHIAAARHTQTLETRLKISESLKRQLTSPEARAALSERTKMSDAARERMKQNAGSYFKGGKTADEFASVLCPAGFVREHRIQWGEVYTENFRLDFAHLEGKVCIELDGPHHRKTQEYDAMREALLKAMGWRVIRIKHD